MAIEFDYSKIKSKKDQEWSANKKKGSLDLSKIRSSYRSSRRDKLSRYSDFADKYNSWLNDTNNYLTRSEDKKSVNTLPFSKASVTGQNENKTLIGSTNSVKYDIGNAVTGKSKTDWNDPTKADDLESNTERISAEAKKLLEALEDDRQYMTEEGYTTYKAFLEGAANHDYTDLSDALTQEAEFRKKFATEGQYNEAVVTQRKNKRLGIDASTTYKDLMLLLNSENISDTDREYVEKLANSREYIYTMTPADVQVKIQQKNRGSSGKMSMEEFQSKYSPLSPESQKKQPSDIATNEKERFYLTTYNQKNEKTEKKNWEDHLLTYDQVQALGVENDKTTEKDEIKEEFHSKLSKPLNFSQLQIADKKEKNNKSEKIPEYAFYDDYGNPVTWEEYLEILQTEDLINSIFQADWNAQSDEWKKSNELADVTLPEVGVTEYTSEDRDKLSAIYRNKPELVSKLINGGTSAAHDKTSAYFDYLKAKEDAYNKRLEDEKWAKEHPVLATLYQIGSTPFQIGEYVGNTFSGDGGELRRRTEVYNDEYTNRAQTYQSSVAKQIDESIDSEFLSWIATTAYSGVTSSVESLVLTGACTVLSGGNVAAGSAISLSLMGSKAAANAYNQAIKTGSSYSQALTYSFAAGFNEAIMEKTSMDNLLKTAKNLTKDTLAQKLKSAIKDTAMQGIIEGAEELGTEILNGVADSIINADLSQYNASIQRYMMVYGLSQADAEKKASEDYLMQIIESVVGGFIGGTTGSGGAVEVGKALYSPIKQRTEAKNAGRDIIENHGGIDAFIDEVQNRIGLDPEANADLFKKLEKLKGSEKNDSGKYSASTARLANEIWEEALDALGRDSEAKRVQIIENKLKEKGLSENEAAKISEEIASSLKNESSMEALKSKFEGNEAVLSAIDELTNEESDSFDASLYDSLGTEQRAIMELALGREKARAYYDTNYNISSEENGRIDEAKTELGEVVRFEKITNEDGDSVSLPVIKVGDREVPISEIELSADSIYKYANEKNSVEAANEMIGAYKKQGSGIDAETFAKEWEYAYQMGRANRNGSHADFLSYNFSIPREAAENARAFGEREMQRGLTEQKKDIKKAQRKKTGREGRVSFDNVKNLKKITKEHKRIASLLSLAGYNIDFFENSTKKSATDGGQRQYSKNGNQEIIDLSNDNKLSALVKGVFGSKRYSLIREYILKELENQPIKLTDGKEAVVDRRDAQHIAEKSSQKKIAEISQIKKIIENAELVAEESSSKEKKFDYFWYYEAFVFYNNEVIPVYVNVGRARNDSSYHIYDITQKIRDTAHRLNDVARPVGYALGNGISSTSIFGSLEKSNSKGKNSLETSSGELYGYYDWETNTIGLNVDASFGKNKITGLLGQTLSHEITHSIQRWNLDGYEELKSFVREKMGDSFEHFVSARMKGLGLERAEAIDEVIAYSCEMMLRDSKALTEFAKEHRRLFEKICDVVEDFIKKIRNAIAELYGADTAFHEEARLMELYADELQEVFDRVLKETLDISESTVNHDLQSNANKKTATESGRVQYSTEAKYLETIKSIASTSSYNNREEIIKMGEYTPDILIEKAEAKQRPIVTRFDNLYGIIRKDGDITPLNYHSMGEEFAANILYFLEDPIKIIKLKNGRLNIIIDYSTNKNVHSLVSIELEQNKEYKGKYSRYNYLVTAFDTGEQYISRIENNSENTVLYDKEKDGESQVNRHRYEYVTIINDSPSNDSILGSSEKSKGKVQKSVGVVSKAETATFAKDKYFDSQINKWETLSHGSYVKVGVITKNHPLVKVGMAEGMLRYDVSKLQKNMADHMDYLTKDLLRAIPEIIANPIAITEFRETNTVSVFGNVFVGSSPMMVGITISKDRAGNDINKVRTFNARKDVAKLITEDTILYLNENKKGTRDWFQACGIQVPLGGTKFGFIRSISQNHSEFKGKLPKSAAENYDPYEPFVPDSYYENRRVYGESLLDALERTVETQEDQAIIDDYRAAEAEVSKKRQELSALNKKINDTIYTPRDQAEAEKLAGFDKDVKKSKKEIRSLTRELSKVKADITVFEHIIADDSSTTDSVSSAREGLKKARREQRDLERRIAANKTIATESLKQAREMRSERTQELENLKRDATKLKNDISKADRSLLDMRSAKNFKALLSREKAAAIKETKSEMFRRQKESKNRRDATQLRQKIWQEMSKLDKLLASDTVAKHIPSDMKSTVAALSQAVAGRDIDYDSRIASLEEKMANTTGREYEDAKALLSKYHLWKNSAARTAAILEEVFASIDQDSPIFDETLFGKVQAMALQLRGKSMNELEVHELSDLLEVINEVKAAIKNSNRVFGEKQSLKVIGALATQQVLDNKKEISRSPARQKLHKALSGIGYSLLKPYELFEMSGSKVLAERYRKLQAREGIYHRDISESSALFLKSAQKNGITKKQLNEKTPFTTLGGEEVALSTNQIMYFYLLSKRAPAMYHLTDPSGGFRFADGYKIIPKKAKAARTADEKIKAVKYTHTSSPVTLTEMDVHAIAALLTEEQKDFADDLQKYMAHELADKGNEVSLVLHDVKKFTDPDYVPMHTDAGFRLLSIEKATGEMQLKNLGFTKELKYHANGPLVIENLTDVFARHANEMALYHAFAVELENLKKVINFSMDASESTDGKPIDMKAALGDEMIAELVGFIKEVNGGIKNEAEGFADKLISLNKAAKVGTSLSVAIQQPSAICRAFAMIDPKYYLPGGVEIDRDGKLWDEMEKYTATAGIKRLGGVDINTSRGIIEEITDTGFKGRGISGNIGKVIQKGSFGLAEQGDRTAWKMLWHACKREASESYSGEEILIRAGERFDEIINRTQVYDSVFSRSKIMRSKNTLNKMATAFMGEPITTANMVIQAVRDIKSGDRARVKAGIRSIGSVVATSIVNAALVSLVYAMRDDDEDESYLQKYLESFLQRAPQDLLNISQYVPYLKDFWSVFQGYDVERMDLSLVGDVIDCVKKIAKTAFDENATDEDQFNVLLDFSSKIFDLTGVPMSNAVRDIKGVIYTIENADTKGTPQGWKEAAWDGLFENAVLLSGLAPSSKNADKLYRAIMSGDRARYKQITARLDDEGKTLKQIQSLIVTGLKNNDERITDAAEARNSGDTSRYMKILEDIVKDGFAKSYVEKAVSSKISQMNKKEPEESELGIPDPTESENYYSIFDINDIYINFEYGDLEEAQIAIDDIFENKLSKCISELKDSEDEDEDEGDAERKALSSVRNMISGKYRDIYKASDEAERERIRELLLGIYIDGEQLYNESTIDGWGEDD